MLLNRRDFNLRKYDRLGHDTNSVDKESIVSICVPMRNEEENIDRLLPAILNQSDSRYEILILDDQSEDRTRDVLVSYVDSTPVPLTILDGKPKPEDWLGKPWACYQLSQSSKGEFLVFIDADTVPSHDFIEHILKMFSNPSVDSVTIWPDQEFNGFWQKTVLPLVYYALLTLLPFRYMRRRPLWMPSFFYEKYKHLFSAANGQCIGFRTSVYDQIGGHKEVKNQVVEDVALARNIRKSDFRIEMYPGLDVISCRMYENEFEMKQGFKKNFLAGFGDHIPLFIGMAALHLIVFLFPFFTFFWAFHYEHTPLLWMSTLNILTIYSSRLLLNYWFKWPFWYIFSHPLGVLWFQNLGIHILWDRLTGKKTLWKGRTL